MAGQDEGQDELAQLEALLAAEGDGEGEREAERVVDLFAVREEPEPPAPEHAGRAEDTDSEEEGLGSRYSQCGSAVRSVLRREQDERTQRRLDFEVRLREQNRLRPGPAWTAVRAPVSAPAPTPASTPAPAPTDVYTDPVWGVRVTRPLVSSSALLERMSGREAVSSARIKRHVETGDVSREWATAGVLVRSSGTRESRKGSRFAVWTLSDLRDDLKSVSLFLFGKAYAELWKTNVGTVVAVLNPSVLDKSEERADEACLSVDTPDRVMIIGQSKDYGVCKSRKKNGDPCTAFVNIAKCEHCIYHVKQEYQKFSRRQELQSSTMGKGLVDLQNKVLGKSTVIYGGRAYSAIPSAKNKKILKKDENRLMSLSDYYKSESDKLIVNKSPYGGNFKKGSAPTIHPEGSQRLKDLDRLERLQTSQSIVSNNNVNSNFVSNNVKKLPHVTGSPSLADKVADSSRFSLTSPKLNNKPDTRENFIDLSINYGEKARLKARENAVKIIQGQGGIKKIDPHNVKGTETGKKRVFETFNNKSEETDCKKAKVEASGRRVVSERFKKILEATSAHQNLIQDYEDCQQEQYFNKLEKKEAMEEKMLNTYKLECKAVRCIKCKYTSFSASERCKQEGHPLKLLDAVKRFFKCGDCGNRTVALTLLPLHTCGNCSGSRWERAAMLRDRSGVAPAHQLSIRGEEETHIGGAVSTGKNINLLVPE